jgi:hypothetical protein
MEVADPDGACAGRDGARLDSDRDLAHDRVRLRVDHAEVVRLDPTDATVRSIPEHEESRERRGQHQRRRDGKYEPLPPPERGRDRRLGGLGK